MKPLDVSSLLKPSPNFGQNLIKTAIVLFEMVGQIIPCILHGIICPTISQKSRTGYAPPVIYEKKIKSLRMSQKNNKL